MEMSKSKILVIFSVFTVCIGLCSNLFAAALVYKQINFEWEYDVSLKELAGYILYHNGAHLHTVNNPKALSVDLNVGLLPGSVSVFTMKAFDINKKESALSAPYDLAVPLPVKGSNFLPTAILSSVIKDTPPNTVEFSAIGSTDFDGDIVSYGWNFGDGTSASTPSCSHTFASSGTYVVVLSVIDNGGDATTTSATITVGSPISTPVNFKVSPF